MRDPGLRRLTIVDVMVLVGGVAIGLAWMRVVRSGAASTHADSYVEWLLRGPSTCVAAGLAVALIVLRLRRPRPRRRRLVIQAGFVACAATLASLILGTGCWLFFEMVHTRTAGSVRPMVPSSIWSWSTAAVPGFLTGSWLGLWLARRWATEPSWIDRAGRIVGAFWIAGALWSQVGPILKYFAPML